MAHLLHSALTHHPAGRREFDYLKSWIAARAAGDAAGGRDMGEEFEQFFTHIFNKSKDGISIHAADFTVVGVNATMRDWYGGDRPLVGRKCYEAYHGRDRVCEHCPLEAAVRTARPQVGVVPYQVGGKALGDQELSVFPLFDDGRRLLCVIEFVRDITSLERDPRIIENLKRRIQCQEHTLHEQEAALSVLMRQGHKLEQRIAEEIALNIDVLVMPLVARLKARCQDGEAVREVALIEQRLMDIASTHSSRLSRALRVLSVREHEVATLIRQGKTSKEIAASLRISAKAVDFHRTNIRKKLGLENAPGSLRSVLLELEHPSSTPG